MTLLTDDELKAKLLDQTAPKITPDSIRAKITKVEYHTFQNNTLTICIITLENGFTVKGSSACASPENYNQEIGEKIAYENAFREIWPLEGYLLKQALYENKVN